MTVTAATRTSVSVPKDILARRVPVALKPGDRVEFTRAGAYAWNISHHDFLMHRRPSFHYLS
ncbi:hypothetical protein [Streptosporangium sp. CA-115845]|uniref:hypothetical protein n=1 Tax=Streptosporangium sp. CA-115845 TaxID=3240071 RepID=UPI003D89ED9E